MPRPERFEHVFAPAGTLTVVAGQRVLDLRSAGLTGGQFRQKLARTWASAEITEDDFVGGQASEVLPVAGLPANIILVSAHVETLGGPVVGTADTTGLTVKVGTAGDDDGYVAATSIFGAAGAKDSVGAALQGGRRGADTLQATLTATGAGAEDLADITGLRLRIVVHYFDATTP